MQIYDNVSIPNRFVSGEENARRSVTPVLDSKMAGTPNSRPNTQSRKMDSRYATAARRHRIASQHIIPKYLL
jgi:hypothetical protein